MKLLANIHIGTRSSDVDTHVLQAVEEGFVPELMLGQSKREDSSPATRLTYPPELWFGIQVHEKDECPRGVRPGFVLRVHLACYVG